MSMNCAQALTRGFLLLELSLALCMAASASFFLGVWFMREIDAFELTQKKICALICASSIMERVRSGMQDAGAVEVDGFTMQIAKTAGSLPGYYDVCVTVAERGRELGQLHSGMCI